MTGCELPGPDVIVHPGNVALTFGLRGVKRKELRVREEIVLAPLRSSQFGSKRKTDMFLRLLRGDLEALSRE